eukprot:478843-Lingulodinium_polyedra.AAC.1
MAARTCTGRTSRPRLPSTASTAPPPGWQRWRGMASSQGPPGSPCHGRPRHWLPLRRSRSRAA